MSGAEERDRRDEQIEAACEVMHDAYERAAVEAGWETQERSRVSWSEAPAANKATMRVAVSALLDHLAAADAAAPTLADKVAALVDEWDKWPTVSAIARSVVVARLRALLAEVGDAPTIEQARAEERES